MGNFEKHIRDQVQSDTLPFEADPGIHERLMYHMELKSAKSSVRKNYFLPFANLLLTQKLMAWKVGVAAIIIAVFIGSNPYQPNLNHSVVADSTIMINAIDTTHIFFEDTLSIN